MAQFNLADYETVEQRIARFYKDHPYGRILTENLTTLQDRQVSTWVVKAEIYIPKPEAFLNDGANDDYWFLKATGLAFEVDSNRGPNQTSALENCETSAIGRALANAGYSGNKRNTREEMAKVERGISPVAPVDGALVDWLAAVNDATTQAELKEIWEQVAGFADAPVNGTTLKLAILAKKKLVK